MVITEITRLEKGRVRVSFDTANPLVFYKSEIRGLGLEEQMPIDAGLYEHLFYEIVGKRAVKRAMHLLEKMDRTEWQLRKKLEQGDYPVELIDQAVAYVKSYRYLDDDRYARTFVRLNQERKSMGRIRMDLLSRGIPKDLIEHALEEENEMPQGRLIEKLLQKKNYDKDSATLLETKKIYQFLIRRGFRSEEILPYIRCAE